MADANALADRDPRVDDAVVADLGLAADRHVRVHDRPRADARAFADRTANGPMDTLCSERDALADQASSWTPGAGRQGSSKRLTARANARYGWRARSIAHGAASALSPRMTAEARVGAELRRVLRDSRRT